jgi:hypothetical protein
MNKPRAIEYETPHKTVVLSDPKQLIIKQGFRCIRAGSVKVNGKYKPLFVRYGNKPELLSEIEAWLLAWDEYNKWYTAQVEAAKSTMITNTPLNFDEAENEFFAWSHWDGTSGKTLKEKATGREIYQMKYTDNSKSVEGETRVKAIAFWDALEELQDDPKPAPTQEEEAASSRTIERLPAENNHPGWCNQCHSYCYGDCQS